MQSSFFLKEGGEKVAFKPIVAFGENSSQPHYHPKSKRKLRKGENVLIDMGVILNHYNSDLTRVLFFGPPNKEIQKIYKVVFQAVNAALALQAREYHWAGGSCSQRCD